MSIYVILILWSMIQCRFQSLALHAWYRSYNQPLTFMMQVVVAYALMAPDSLRRPSNLPDDCRLLTSELPPMCFFWIRTFGTVR